MDSRNKLNTNSKSENIEETDKQKIDEENSKNDFPDSDNGTSYSSFNNIEPVMRFNNNQISSSNLNKESIDSLNSSSNLDSKFYSPNFDLNNNIDKNRSTLNSGEHKLENIKVGYSKENNNIGSLNLCFGSPSNENSSANLLALDNSDEISLNYANEVLFVDGKKNRINHLKNVNALRPLDKLHYNNASQSSMETRITSFGDKVDLIPLMPLNNNGTMQQNQVESDDDHKERWYTIFLQVFLPFFIAGFGMVAAGVVLDRVQHWELYKNISAIYTLVPALLGLKGNLEMTLASRLSTQANLGKINDKTTTINAVLGNFALTQAQAIVVGFLASIGALTLKIITEREIDFKNGLVLISGSISTASFASLLLAGLMMFVIIISKKFKINPDNIATPIAASLGDLVTLTILSFLCTFLYQIKSFIWIHVLIFVLYLMLVPVFVYYSYRNDFVKDALYNGWTAIIMSMVISSTGGYIMGFAVNIYGDIAVFQPVVNGVGGNLVAIFASRLSTALHRTSTQGSKAYWAPKKWYYYPLNTFFGKSNPESNTAIVLVLLAFPGHLLFFFTISKIKMFNHEDSYNASLTTNSFIIFYLFVSTLQVILLILICYWLVHFIWQKNKNPDNICIPYLTAIGDLLGTAFLAICFHLLFLAGEVGLRKPV